MAGSAASLSQPVRVHCSDRVWSQGGLPTLCLEALAAAWLTSLAAS